MVFYLGHLLKPIFRLAQLGKAAAILAFVTHLGSLLLRTAAGLHTPGNNWYAPWSNWFESFSFFAFVITGCFLLIQRFRPLPILGCFISPIPVVALAFSLASPFGRAIPVLSPALQSVWMVIHVPVMFLSYAALVNAFGVGLAFVIQERQLKSKRPGRIAFQLPPLEELDNLIYGIIAAAFPGLTLGILLGALWANQAWGRYWGWDPKETWSFITWMVYLIFLHMRLLSGWRGRKSAYLSLAGFGILVFTYVGVNYFSPLHGFLSGGGR